MFSIGPAMQNVDYNSRSISIAAQKYLSSSQGNLFHGAYNGSKHSVPIGDVIVKLSTVSYHAVMMFPLYSSSSRSYNNILLTFVSIHVTLSTFVTIEYSFCLWIAIECFA